MLRNRWFQAILVLAILATSDCSAMRMRQPENHNDNNHSNVQKNFFLNIFGPMFVKAASYYTGIVRKVNEAGVDPTGNSDAGVHLQQIGLNMLEAGDINSQHEESEAPKQYPFPHVFMHVDHVSASGSLWKRLTCQQTGILGTT